MEINITGFEKLLAIVKDVLGMLTGNYFYRQQTKDEVKRIKSVSKAISEVSNIANVNYEKDGIQITPLNPSYVQMSQLPIKDLPDRTSERALFQSQNQQLNIESVVRRTAEILKTETSVAKEPVNRDWAVRFFNIVKDVSTKELQLLWSKILAGEIKQPGGFSLRTLEMIRNLSKEEAEIINKVANYTFLGSDTAFIPKVGMDFLKEKGIIKPVTSFLLKEIGVWIHEEGYGTAINYTESSKEDNPIFTYGDTIFKIDFTEEVVDGDLLLDIRSFSKSGTEIIKIINPIVDHEYLNFILKNVEIREHYGNKKFKLKIFTK